VWLAEDVRHRRRVAVKVLHPELSAVLGPERFLKEIELTANLQHPHILPLFDSGSAAGLLYYVMPYVDGETLRARLERERQLPVADALRIAAEVADALDYAHRRGVVHRDVKPENVLLQDGHVVVADFGIALAVQQAGAQRMTQTGLSLGTPQYMAPEQAMGERQTDARADVYALGAVTYEMLVGEPPFTGATVQAIVAKVLTERPMPPSSARDTVPAPVEDAVLRALAKLPADRFASARDFAAALAAPVPVTTRSTHARIPAAGPRRPAMLLALGAACVAAAGLAAWGWLRTPPVADAPSARFTVDLPRGIAFDNVFAPLTITHDGRTLIFRALVHDTVRLVRRDVDRLEVVPIPGTEDAGWPAVSPDDKWLAFRARGLVYRVSLAGSPATLVDSTNSSGGLTWATNEALVLAEPGVRMVAVTGGVREVPKAASMTRPGDVPRWPLVLPDGDTMLYVSWPPGGVAGARLAVASLATGESTVLDVAGSYPLGVADGQLFYVSGEGTVSAVPFDVRARRVTGAPRALLAGVDVNAGVGAARAALATSGTLAYLAGAPEGAGRNTQLVEIGPDGAATRTLLAGGNIFSPVWSPDGARIAVTVIPGAGGIRQVGVLDVATGAFEQLTSEGGGNPTWSPDGRRLVFYSQRGGRGAIWWQPADGSGGAEKLVDVNDGLNAGSGEGVLSPDGRWLVYTRSAPEGPDIWAMELAGDRRPHPLVAERGAQETPALSPDGRWLAYSSPTAGAGSREVYVRPFPGPGAATRVSTEGGAFPRWAPDGRSLYYVANLRDLMAATVSPGATMNATMGVTRRRLVTRSQFLTPGASNRPAYAVSPDGKRFVGLSRVNPDAKLVVVTNWLAELRRTQAGARAR
jgi:serine/threonine-protein kinase